MQIITSKILKRKEKKNKFRFIIFIKKGRIYIIVFVYFFKTNLILNIFKCINKIVEITVLLIHK